MTQRENKVLLTPYRFPREGGDPGPYTPAVIDPLDPRLRGERGGGRFLPRHCEARSVEATQGNIRSGSGQSTGLLRCARNDAEGKQGPHLGPLPQGEGLSPLSHHPFPPFPEALAQFAA